MKKPLHELTKQLVLELSAFIQKPFTLDEIKKAIDIAESEYSLLQ